MTLGLKFGGQSFWRAVKYHGLRVGSGPPFLVKLYSLGVNDLQCARPKV